MLISFDFLTIQCRMHGDPETAEDRAARTESGGPAPRSDP
ncbi:hypothetical protein D779_1193 [Imhoffiella purpurea]|uniref:Uncharacterized protein n=1 Tax=Imhoffiella purpurea TaxID=1249627 RepID=W9VEP1_9GAMM|nr:hypothetical protein D779_1193 [Imhoffiella purpurea]